MMLKKRILIIDDEIEKRRDFYESVLSSSFELVFFRNGAEFEEHFDCYVIDFDLSKMFTGRGSSHAAPEVINEYKLSPVIVVTGRPDKFLTNISAETSCDNEALRGVGFSHSIQQLVTLDTKVHKLIAWSDFEAISSGIAVNYIAKHIDDAIAAGPDRYTVDIAVIAAMSSEMDPFVEFIEKDPSFNVESPTPNLPGRFFSFVDKLGKKKKGVIVISPKMGQVAASTTLYKLLSKCEIKSLFMIGVCAGNKNNTQLGDLIIASNSFPYQHAKVDDEEYGLRAELKTRRWDDMPHYSKNFKKILMDFKELLENDSELSNVCALGKKDFVPALKDQGGMLCGDSVVSKAGFIQDVVGKSGNEKINSLDMESYAVYYFADTEAIDKCAVIKSVMDHGEHKEDSFKQYGQHQSAYFLYRVIADGYI